MVWTDGEENNEDMINKISKKKVKENRGKGLEKRRENKCKRYDGMYSRWRYIVRDKKG